MDETAVGIDMRTVNRNSYSSLSNVASGVPQGLLLAPFVFQIYKDDMLEGLNSSINLYADSAKL